MYTGKQLYEDWKREVASYYNAFYESATGGRAERLFLKSFTLWIEENYKNQVTLKQYDFLTSLISTNALFTPVNNELTTIGVTPVIPNYRHLFAIRAKFKKDIGLKVVSGQAISPIVLKVDKRSNLATKEKVEVSGVIWLTNANGTFYIKKLNAFQIALYNDKDLRNPSMGNAPYQSGGKIERVYENYCTQYYSSRKIAPLTTPTLNNPYFEIANGKIKVYPLDEVCSEVSIDYLTNTSVFPVPSDTTTDLELTYPLQFLIGFVSSAARIYGEEVRDTELVQFEMNEKQIN